jgi:hypothetical protein
MAWLAKRMFRISDERAMAVFKCNAPSFGKQFRKIRSRKFKPLGQRDNRRLYREWRDLAQDIRYGSRNTYRATVTEMRLKLAKIMLASLHPDLISLMNSKVQRNFDDAGNDKRISALTWCVGSPHHALKICTVSSVEVAGLVVWEHQSLR